MLFLCYIRKTRFLMKKLLFILGPLVISILLVVGVYFFFIRNSGKGALQVTSEPKSTVYLNDQIIGQTPLCRCDANTMILSGEYTVRLVPLEGSYSPYESKININTSVMTAVDRVFQDGASATGSIITLTPLKEKNKLAILAISFPDKAKVFLDNDEIGKTPLLYKDTTDSDHELRFEKDGYEEKVVRIKTVLGYTLSATVFLGLKPDLGVAPITSSSANATLSASLTPSPKVARVTILSTPTGFLRVRADASISSSEIAKVNPGDNLELISEKEGWYEIKLTDGKTGWISSNYAQKE